MIHAITNINILRNAQTALLHEPVPDVPRLGGMLREVQGAQSTQGAESQGIGISLLCSLQEKSSRKEDFPSLLTDVAIGLASEVCTEGFEGVGSSVLRGWLRREI